MKYVCAIDLKIHLMLRYIQWFLLIKSSTAVTGLRCLLLLHYQLCCLCLFVCHAENELKLWSSYNHPFCTFSFFFFILFIFSGLLHCFSGWFSMRPHLFCVLAQWWCDKKDWDGNQVRGLRRCSSQPCCWGERGLGRQCFQIQLRDWTETLVCSAQKSFSVWRDDLIIQGFQQHYLIKELLSQSHASESSFLWTLLVQGSVSGTWYLNVSKIKV